MASDGAPVNPGGVKPTVIACEDAEADVMVGEVGKAATIWKARETLEAGAYTPVWPDCDAVTSHVPISRIVITPNVETEHAELVVAEPRL